MTEIETFRETVWGYYRQNRRDLPWRETPFEPYHILVSEMMLQQTQVPRVIPKYETFLERFPTITELAKATTGDVLREWNGLGYNRRAKYLHEAAKVLQNKIRPWSAEDLEACKGIGKNTAAAVIVYAYDLALLFIETNIRTVYIHHFFAAEDSVTDADVLELLDRTLDRDHPRDFYYALMDYGSFLKKEVGNLSRSSAHYKKQAAFHGSKRQIRGAVLRQLTDGSHNFEELQIMIADTRLPEVLKDLMDEQLIDETNGSYHL